MCGIAGFTRTITDTSNSSYIPDPLSTIRAMCDAMSHRGPDGEGYLISDDIVFGHRRLSLLDIEGGAQPMSRDEGPTSVTHVASPDDLPSDTALDSEFPTPPSASDTPVTFCPPSGYQIVFNGEIYNYRDLRAELESIGYAFNTDCDTEVLLTAYIEWGTECLPRLRGMFAFAVYDAPAHTLFLARDAFGIKPLYWLYTEDDGTDGIHDAAPSRTFAFASEIKSLLELPSSVYSRSLNLRALEQYMSFQYSVLHETFFEGIYKLEPGHFMTLSLDTGKLSAERWFFPDYDIDESLTVDEAASRIHEAIQNSVSYHKIADVEVGSFLSSGVDSNYLAASLVHQSAPNAASDEATPNANTDEDSASARPPVKTFTVGFDTPDGAKYNEINYAADAAAYLGVENISHAITPEEFWEDFPRIQWHMDEPLADPAAAALWFVDREAAKHVKAVLSGEGADELFGGYPIYQTSVENKKLAWIPNGVKRYLAHFLHKHGMRGANYLDRASTSLENRFIGNAYIFTKKEREELLLVQEDEEGLDEMTHFSPEYVVAGTYDCVSGLDETTKMQYIDLNHWMVGDILLKTDKMAMAHSLESRVPFLDKEVWRVARTLPEKTKVSHETSKLALRVAAEKEMPSDYTTKPKLGFPVPIRVWLAQDEYYEKVREALASSVAQKFFNTERAVKLLDDHKAGIADNSRKIWVLYTFIVWYEQYFGDDVDK